MSKYFEPAVGMYSVVSPGVFLRPITSLIFGRYYPIRSFRVIGGRGGNLLNIFIVLLNRHFTIYQQSNIGLVLHGVQEYELSLKFLEEALKINLKYHGEKSLKAAIRLVYNPFNLLNNCLPLDRKSKGRRFESCTRSIFAMLISCSHCSDGSMWLPFW